MKYINPVYTALVKNGYRDLAYQWYMEKRDFYHPIAAAGLRKILLQSPNPVDEAMLQRN